MKRAKFGLLLLAMAILFNFRDITVAQSVINNDWYVNSYRKLFFDYHTYEVALSVLNNTTQVHLVNHYREKSIGDAINIVEHVLPVYDIGLKVKMSSIPKSVLLQPEGLKLEWKYSDKYVSFRVPKLDIYSIVVIE